MCCCKYVLSSILGDSEPGSKIVGSCFRTVSTVVHVHVYCSHPVPLHHECYTLYFVLLCVMVGRTSNHCTCEWVGGLGQSSLALLGGCVYMYMHSVVGNQV